MRTHNEMQCDGEPCVVHNPSDHHMKTWPIVYRMDRAVEMPPTQIGRATIAGPVFVLAERTCPHGVGHPDPDSIGFARRRGGGDFASVESVHGCDGCCRPGSTHPEDDEVEELLTSGPWRFLPDDHPHVVKLRKRFNAAMDVLGPVVVSLDEVALSREETLGALEDLADFIAEPEVAPDGLAWSTQWRENERAEEEMTVQEFDAAVASGEVMVTAPPPGWLGPIRVAHPTTVTWRHVSNRALVPWDEPIWLALTPRQKMDGPYYPVVLGYFDGDGFIEYGGPHLDDEVTHWADAEYPAHPTKLIR
jgi:hypothetical protein